tara:strand:- start:456 stop:1112 length:657 start_codon:yes stop_codon:yes gene_type:complete
MPHKGLEIPKEWTFHSEQIAKGFDEHVREQLPWYDLVTSMIVHYARNYIPQNGVVYDIGCSTGNIGIAIQDILQSRQCKFIAIDNSQDMENAYRGPELFTRADIETYDFGMYDFGIMFLSLMFVRVNRRGEVLRNIRRLRNPGGALIVFDKMQHAGGYAGTVLQRLALSEKIRAGVSPSNVIDKELSLSGVQRPLESSLIEEATPIFQFGEFRGFLFD